MTKQKKTTVKKEVKKQKKTTVKKEVKKPKNKISKRLPKKSIDDRAETLNPQNKKYYKSRIEGINEEQAIKLAKIEVKKRKIK
ncbi:hypothetical protein SAMN04489761_3068 [Tenacibaculum sp. MAR_2009_124]|uniref:hypothetical protein n=1 Tax=Tenacibaculum sp. MAR_2009_124 TaxID=1250059 RepID=UPI000894A0E9|nr:hypothetical protein [Tenacibaculum sp. MAR_2009_124]SEC46506.1 hypothetical protein SAMN04489761_3068 [Tenacibaculum sp. MAR_2009_124]